MTDDDGPAPYSSEIDGDADRLDNTQHVPAGENENAPAPNRRTSARNREIISDETKNANFYRFTVDLQSPFELSKENVIPGIQSIELLDPQNKRLSILFLDNTNDDTNEKEKKIRLWLKKKNNTESENIVLNPARFPTLRFTVDIVEKQITEIEFDKRTFKFVHYSSDTKTKTELEKVVDGYVSQRKQQRTSGGKRTSFHRATPRRRKPKTVSIGTPNTSSPSSYHHMFQLD